MHLSFSGLWFKVLCFSDDIVSDISADENAKPPSIVVSEEVEALNRKNASLTDAESAPSDIFESASVKMGRYFLRSERSQVRIQVKWYVQFSMFLLKVHSKAKV